MNGDTSPTDAMLERARAGRPDTPTPMQLVEQLGQTLDGLETALDRLREHLEPVLLDDDPAPALAVEPSAGRTLLAQRLTHLTAYAERLRVNVNRLDARVEL